MYGNYLVFLCLGKLEKMAGVQLGVSPQIRCTDLARKHLHDWVILVVLGVIIGLLNLIEPFHRYLSKEMLTPDVKYPFKEDSIPMFAVPVCVKLILLAPVSLSVSLFTSLWSVSCVWRSKCT